MCFDVIYANTGPVLMCFDVMYANIGPVLMCFGLKLANIDPVLMLLKYKFMILIIHYICSGFFKGLGLKMEVFILIDLHTFFQPNNKRMLNAAFFYLNPLIIVSVSH